MSQYMSMAPAYGYPSPQEFGGGSISYKRQTSVNSGYPTASNLRVKKVKSDDAKIKNLNVTGGVTICSIPPENKSEEVLADGPSFGSLTLGVTHPSIEINGGVNLHVDDDTFVMRDLMQQWKEVIAQVKDFEMRLRVLEFRPRNLGGPKFEEDYAEEANSGLLSGKEDPIEDIEKRLKALESKASEHSVE